MYKARGKPEDPRNKAAAKQERDLAEAIQVNQIRRNGDVQELQKFAWSPTSRQKELARLRNNFEQFKDTYQERLKKPNMHQKLLKDSGGTSGSDSSYLRHNNTKRFVSGRLNDVCSNDDTTGCHKPAMLQAPPRTLKTIKVEVPVRYKEAAIFCPKKSDGGGEPWRQKLREIEKLQEKLCGHKETNTEEWVETNLVKELQDASVEVDVGNAQLEQINKILEVTKALNPYKQKENSAQQYGKADNLYNVKIAQERLIQFQKQTNKNVKNKSKLLLTLNNVNERIQKLQEKFFKDSRPQYKSLRSRYRPVKVQRHMELLYKNEKFPTTNSNYEVSKDLPKPKQLTEILTSSERTPEHPCSLYESGTQYEEFETPHTEYLIEKRDDDKSLNILEIPPLDVAANNSFVEEYPEQYPEKRDVKYSVFVENSKKTKQQLADLHKILETAKEDNEEFSLKSIFRPKVQETILKSDFLMKEFKIHPKDVYFNVSKIPNEGNVKTNGHGHFSNIAKQRMEQLENSTSYDESKSSKRLSIVNTDYLLKNTLYCADME